MAYPTSTLLKYLKLSIKAVSELRRFLNSITKKLKARRGDNNNNRARKLQRYYE
uniref:Candidate secreted effector n=1 Tax=Meloidogyne incognita TaxID=6306 RepID=A0A914KZK8_MELIC